ncbi:MAG: CDP-alcohol phosphatidyltransferase family protein [Deltaproteobacteria bacterium]|nr:CDP-alcohol phosphatidyltransferase family protein [Deltaproteobacteria bacterium]
MTIPNLITSIRIILAPIFIIYLLNEDFPSALIVFILAGVSDAADGLIARLFNQKSELGAYLDPLADKILLISAFIVLSIKNFVPPWLSVVVITRDIMILLGVLFIFLKTSSFPVRPSVLSKTTTFLQLATIFVALSERLFPAFLMYSEYLFWITGLLTISSGLHYMRYWFRTMGEGSFDD